MDWFRFDIAPPLSQDERTIFKQLAGPKATYSGHTVHAGINSAWLAEAALRHYGRVIKRVVPPEWLTMSAPSQVPHIPEMRETISGFEVPYPFYLLPWQQSLLTGYAHRPGVSLWWAPGAGKTLGAISWSLLTPGRIVFITRSGARRTITRDIMRFTHASHYTLEGEKARDLPDVRFVVTGWDTLAHHVDSLWEWGPTTIVMDEIHRAKSHKRMLAVPARDDNGNPVLDANGMPKMDFALKNNTAAAAKKLSLAPTVRRRLGATATPIKDRIRDLWAQLDLIEPEQWGYFYDWAKRYCNAREGAFGGMDTSGRAPSDYIDELKRRVSMSVFQVPYAVTHANLPPKRRQVTYIPREQLLQDEGAAARRFLKKVEAEDATAWMKAHARLAAAAERKRNAVVEIVADNIGEKGKIVVLTGLRESCEKLAQTVDKKLPGVKMWWGHGDTSAKVRDAIQEEYMDHPGPCILVGTMQVWGESLNLQDTDNAYAAMLPFTPGEAEQFEGRFSRQGQLRPCTINYLIAEGTYDEHVAQLLIDKMPSVERVVGNETGALAGFRKAIGGIENEEALVAQMIAKLTASTYEIDEDNR